MKVLSINLWYKKYGHKTLAQLKGFSCYGYETYAATIINDNSSLLCEIYSINNEQNTIATHRIHKEPLGIAYFEAFRFIFDYATDNQFDLVYMRRLMSKIIYAAPHFKHLSKHCKICYEIPTFPFDVPANALYALRDKLELFTYNCISKYISVTSTCLYQHGKVNPDWLLFENGIDIDNYTIHTVPKLASDSSTINMLMIANMQSWHRSERILYAIKDYTGPHNIKLIVASPDSKEYSDMKSLAVQLGIDNKVEFNDFLPISKINEIAENCHLAVGQLSGSEYGVMETHAIKHKDYCALGLPLFSTCTDTSFPDKYPYFYFLEDADAPINLNDIILWYEDLRKHHPDYREEMYEHARENLQYNGYVSEIIRRTNKEQEPS